MLLKHCSALLKIHAEQYYCQLKQRKKKHHFFNVMISHCTITRAFRWARTYVYSYTCLMHYTFNILHAFMYLCLQVYHMYQSIKKSSFFQEVRPSGLRLPYPFFDKINSASFYNQFHVLKYFYNDYHYLPDQNDIKNLIRRLRYIFEF